MNRLFSVETNLSTVFLIRGCYLDFDLKKLVLEYAKIRGYKIAAGNVRVDNPASIALQKKLGFEIYREWITPNGQSMYFFIKSLE